MVVLLVYFSILFVALQVREREKKSSFMQAFMEKRAEKEAGGKLQIEGKHSGHRTKTKAHNLPQRQGKTPIFATSQRLWFLCYGIEEKVLRRPPPPPPPPPPTMPICLCVNAMLWQCNKAFK